jgi:hypothetical protein
MQSLLAFAMIKTMLDIVGAYRNVLLRVNIWLKQIGVVSHFVLCLTLIFTATKP